MNTGDDTASATVCVDYESKADVQITKIVDRPQFPNTTGEIITWTLNYQNNGPNVANDVTIEDILPDGLIYDGPSMPANDTIASIVATGNKVQYVLSKPLNSGEGGSIVVKSKYIGGKVDNAQLLNIVKINTLTPESDYTNNADDEPTNPISTSNHVADVQITKTVDMT